MIKIIRDIAMWLLTVGTKVTAIGMFLSLGVSIAGTSMSRYTDKVIGEEVIRQLERLKEIQALRKEIDEQGDKLTILLYNIYLERCRKVRAK